jgi:hypothetical protein
MRASPDAGDSEGSMDAGMDVTDPQRERRKQTGGRTDEDRPPV